MDQRSTRIIFWFFSITRQRRERKKIREEKYSRLDGEKMESTALVVPCSIHSYRGEYVFQGPTGKRDKNWKLV